MVLPQPAGVPPPRPPPRPPPAEPQEQQSVARSPPPPLPPALQIPLQPNPNGRQLPLLQQPNATGPAPAADMTQWILSVNVPPPGPHSSAEVLRRASVVQIRISSLLTDRALADCLRHALQLGEASFIAGLFCVQTHIFSSLYDILQGPPTPHLTYSLHPILPPPPRRHVPWWQQSQSVVILASVAIPTAFYFNESLSSLASNWIIDPAYTLQKLIWTTLLSPQAISHWLYGHAIYPLGWNGLSLEYICARSTEYGDADFWLRNLVECERIYYKKQSEFTAWMSPLITLLLSVVAVIVLSRVLLHRPLPPARLPPEHREMLETYRAFQVILRNVSKSWNNGPGRPPPPPRSAT